MSTLARAIRLLTLILALGAGGGARAGLVPPLLDAAEVRVLAGAPDVRVLDIREGRLPDGRSAYEVGHLPDAVWAPYSLWKGGPDNPGRLPDPQRLTALLRGLGIDAQTHVIVVHAGTDSSDFGSAARVYWTLKVAGLSRLSILNGGVAAWSRAGFALNTLPARRVQSLYEARIDRRRLATRDEIEVLVGDGFELLLDARPRAYFEGRGRHPAARIPGTIRGAVNFDNAHWFEPGGSELPSMGVLRALANRAGLDGGEPIISFCNTGHWAATNWFVLSELLGLPDVRLYPESMVDWSEARLQMDNVPGRAGQLWVDAQLWWARVFE